MPKKSELGAFIPLPEIDGVYVAHKSGLRCTAVVGKNGEICLFSPVQGLGTTAKASLSDIGSVSYLLAPNHYHNKALKEFSAAYPKARLCAAPAAAPRLQKVTGFEFDDLSDVAKALPDGLTLLEPDGLKTGEVWLRCDAKRRRTWFVVDAFSGPKILSEDDRSDEPSLLKTFPSFGVRDKTVYVKWLKRQMRADKPKLVVPCHGAISSGTDLPAKLLRLVEQNL